MAIETSKQMFVNMNPRDIPPYDPLKPYYEQKLDVIAFWENERQKIREGVTIGGYFIHPLLYFILNFFKTPVPHRNNKGRVEDIITNPPLNDLLYYIIESYKQAQDSNKILALFGTRGSTKSTFEAAVTHWTIAAYGKGNFQVIGGNQKDLDDISSLIKTTFNNVVPAFRIPTLKANWEDHVEFGYKGKGQSDRRTTYANIFTTNVVGGKGDNSSEKTAGGTPIGYITDEIGKFNFWKTLEAAIPSFKTGGGYRFVPIIAGTSGNSVLSADAKMVLSRPERYSILPMNWDTLDSIVPEEYITWGEDRKREFGTFMPGQLSLRLETPKIETSFGDFIGSKNKELRDTKIRVTDWENASKEIENMTNEDNVGDGADKNKMYYPTKIAHVWLTDNPNPFPKDVIARRILELEEESANQGRRVKILKKGPKNELSLSEKRKADVKHTGGAADAPTLLFMELPDSPPELYEFAGGLDDYKLDTSGTDSLGSHYIILRRNMRPNQPCELIACSYTARPHIHKAFHQEIEDNIEAFSAMTLMEYIDISFEAYLRDKGKDAMWLAPAISFTSSKANANLQRKYGLPPTAGNNEYRFKTLVDWTWEQHVLSIDSDGNPITKYSVEFIDDIDLLKEMLTWSKGGNYDRITAFSHALILAKYWDTHNYRRKRNQFQDNYQHDSRDYYQPKKGRQQAYTFDKKVRNPYGGYGRGR